MMRIGMGYDIHRVVAGGRLVLGGVTLDAAFGLEGHSDADVVVHALIDALLGAAALGDIGTHFPPSDERYRGIASTQLLTAAMDMVRQRGFTVVNADVVIVAEQPRIGPHVGAMKEVLARCASIHPAQISIKATTNEGVGPEGRQEAISAQAVALLESRP